MTRLSYLIFAAFALAVPWSTSWAATILTDAVQSCPETNCASQRIRGQYRSTEPFIVQIFAESGRCLRLQVTGTIPGADLEMQLISPNASSGDGMFAVPQFMWGDDDSGVDANPLIKVDPVPQTGFYTLIVSHWLGGGGDTTFNLRFGLYNTGNDNCDTPNPALGAEFIPSETEDTIKFPE